MPSPFVVSIGAGIIVSLWNRFLMPWVVACVATAVAFGGLSLFGYVTKRDLAPIGSFLVMAVWGLIAAMLIAGHGDPR